MQTLYISRTPGLLDIFSTTNSLPSPAGIVLPSKTVSFVIRLAMTGTGGYILIDSFRHIVRYSKQLSPETSSLLEVIIMAELVTIDCFEIHNS